MAGPGDEIAAGTGGRGYLRASHADRDQVIETLKAAFVQGRLDRDEFDLRVGQALASRTYAELAAVTADIPAGLAAVQPSKPTRARDPKPVRRPGPVITTLGAALAVYAGLWVSIFLAGGFSFANSVQPVAMLVSVLIPMGMVFGALASQDRKRSRGGLPRQPAPDVRGQASRRLPSAGPGGQPPPGGPGQQQRAEAAPIRRPLLPGWRPWATRGYLTHPA